MDPLTEECNERMSPLLHRPSPMPPESPSLQAGFTYRLREWDYATGWLDRAAWVPLATTTTGGRRRLALDFRRRPPPSGSPLLPCSHLPPQCVPVPPSRRRQRGGARHEQAGASILAELHARWPALHAWLTTGAPRLAHNRPIPWPAPPSPPCNCRSSASSCLRWPWPPSSWWWRSWAASTRTPWQSSPTRRTCFPMSPALRSPCWRPTGPSAAAARTSAGGTTALRCARRWPWVQGGGRGAFGLQSCAPRTHALIAATAPRRACRCWARWPRC